MDGNKYTIEEIIRLNGKFVGPTMGVSMLRMLKEGQVPFYRL